MATRRLPRTNWLVHARARVVGLLEAVPRMNLVSVQLVMMEGRRRGIFFLNA